MTDGSLEKLFQQRLTYVHSRQKKLGRSGGKTSADAFSGFNAGEESKMANQIPLGPQLA